MEASFQATEDSRSILDFIKPSKPELVRQKRDSKQTVQQNRRKNSTQMSLSSWMIKKRPKQECEM